MIGIIYTGLLAFNLVTFIIIQKTESIGKLTLIVCQRNFVIFVESSCSKALLNIHSDLLMMLPLFLLFFIIILNREHMLYKYHIILFLLLSNQNLFSQKQGNIWYFGNYAGLDFGSTNPVAISNGQINYSAQQGHNEGSCAISDSTGKLLMYSDGTKIWNKKHQIMENGNFLLGNSSSTQSSIIVPHPKYYNRYYYVFTVGSAFCCGGNITDGLRYSLIDICLDSANGSVLPSKKNIKLIDSVAEKIAVTRHANNIDYWIVTHKYFSDEFWALHLAANGIKDTVISKIGSMHSGTLGGSQGQLKFSNSGLKLAIAATNGLNLLELFDFNKATGIVSNHKPLNVINNGSVYGVEFSADDSKLYSVTYSFAPTQFNLVQYDISQNNLTTINSSLTTIYSENSNISGKGLQIGINSKIYMISPIDETKVSVINNPNAGGLACNYVNQSISLIGNGSYSLPTFIAGFDYSNSETDCNSTAVIETGIVSEHKIFPNPAVDKIIIQAANDEFYNFSLTNTVGKILYTSIHNSSINELDVSYFSNGMYYLQILTKNNTVIKKIIINH